MRKIMATLISLVLTGISGYFAYYFFDKDVINFIIFVSITVVFLIITTVSIMLVFNRKNVEKINWLENRLNVWNSISHHVSAAGDETFTKLPIGIIVYDSNMEVKWANDYAKNVFKNNLINSSLDSITSSFIDDILEGKENMLISAYGRNFDVVHNVENRILYFFDVTRREETLKRYNNRITAMGIIALDNLEESLRRYDVQEQSNIRGQILGIISDWVSANGCCLETLSNDQMFVIFDQDALNKMIADKFSVVDMVRDISNKNHLKASMSMGVACFDIEAGELVVLAQNAIELAQKRGGDQVVVNIQNQKIQYFGGNTNSLEKSTLIEARVQTMALKDAIENSSNVLVMCHNMADCDAIGSMIAVWHLASTINKDCKMVFEADYADYTVKKIFEQIKKENKTVYNGFISRTDAKETIKSNTLLIMTDTQSPKLAMFPDILSEVKNISVIDHHRASDSGYSSTVSSYVETSASSTVELVSEMFLFFDKSVELDPLTASIMLAGIVVDTNNFTYRTRTRTFEAASTLNTMGADMILVRKLLRDSYEEEKRLAEAMVNAMIYEKRFAIVAEPEYEIIADRTILAKISDKMLTIEGVETAFTIGRISHDTVGISARSLDNVNVQIIMEEMEGGGHFNAAATQLRGITVEEAKERLLQIIKRDYVDTGDGTMKVILIADVKGKGKKDDILDVANGYGNFLINNKLALMANEENLKKLAEAQEQERINNENRRNVLEKLKKEIQDKFISVYIKVGADGRNFGHITTKYICDEFEAQTGIHLDKKKVELPAEINSVGIYTANVRLDKDIIATFEINVIEK